MAKYTDEQWATILAEFRRRRRNELLILMPLLGGVFLLVFMSKYPGYHIGSLRGAPLALTGGALFAAGVALHLRNWRCPGCGRPLRGGPAQSVCPACGAVFTEASRREVARAAQAAQAAPAGGGSPVAAQSAAQQAAARKALKRELNRFRARANGLVKLAVLAVFLAIFLIIFGISRMQENGRTSDIVALFGGAAAALALTGGLGYRIYLHTNVRAPAYEAQLRQKLGLPPAPSAKPGWRQKLGLPPAASDKPG